MRHFSKSARAALALILLAAMPDYAATYYISKSLGSDSNTTTQAQSKATPWAHLPGMTGCTTGCTSNSPQNLTPQPGDNFILYGGDTWGNSDLGDVWTWSGSATTCSPGCCGSGCIYIGVDQTWYNSSVCGSSWCRPIFNAQGSPVTTPFSLGNVLFYQANNYVIVDNIEMKGLNWTGTPAYGTAVHFVFEAGSIGHGTNDIVENLYIHGWTHGAYPGTHDSSCGIIGDTGTPNLNVNSLAKNNVIDGSDTDQQSCNGAFFGSPPYIENNFVQWVASSAIVDGTVQVTGNTFLHIPPSFETGAHTNGLEINATNANVVIADNLIAHLGSGTLGIWCAPDAANTCQIYDNVVYDTDTGNIIDLAAPVCNGGCTCGTSYCTTAGSANLINNTIECGPDSGPSAVCVPGTASGFTAVLLENNHFITSNGSYYTTGGGAIFTVTTNLPQSLSTACLTDLYCSSQTYPFSPTSGTSPTVGAGTNAISTCSGCAADTTDGVGYDAVNHKVTGPFRPTVARPASGAWDQGAYMWSNAVPVAPSLGMFADCPALIELFQAFEATQP